MIGRAANKCGGVVVEELLGHSPPFPIADFWFEEYGIVAELKVMEQDMFSNEDFIQQTTDLYRTWVDRGFDVPIVLGSRPVSTKDIPPECSIELLGLIKAKIKNAFLRKANKQIRSTKKKLGKPDSFGLLLLGNDGSMGFHPSLIANLLHHSLANQYRSIEGVIYFTGNCKAKFPGFLEPLTTGRTWQLRTGDLFVQISRNDSEKLGSLRFQLQQRSGSCQLICLVMTLITWIR